MNRYWDRTEKERAEMTREQVQSFIDVELMEKGVLKVEPPQLQPFEEVVLPKATYYEVYRKGQYGVQGSSVLFLTPEKAQAFIDLGPLWEDSNWNYADKHFAQAGRELSIRSTELPCETDVVNAGSALKRNETIEKNNKELQEGYSNQLKAVEDAASGVWDDWQECQQKAREHKRIIDTRAEYLRLCGNNAMLADTFLAKAFTEDQVKAAKAWFGIEEDKQQPTEPAPA